MPSNETAAERRARIKRRLSQAETPQEEVSRNVLTSGPTNTRPREPKPEPVKETDIPEPVEGGSDDPSPTGPNSNSIARGVKDRATQRRQNKPTNYKIHVITALGLAFGLRVVAVGLKTAVGYTK